MNSAARNNVAIGVLVIGVLYGAFRYTLHLSQLEHDNAALLREQERQALQARRERQQRFAHDCRAREGQLLPSCPDICVKRETLIEVMP